MLTFGSVCSGIEAASVAWAGFDAKPSWFAEIEAFPSSVLDSRFRVRRLMPVECERLQGFPDGHTLIKVGKNVSKDGPRYKALGNSMAVPVMQWIGKRVFDAMQRDTLI